MTRNLLLLAFVAFVFWSGRSFWLKKRPRGKAPPPRRPENKAGGGQEPVDLVRDEKTGEYRLKED
ncbi:hypothetical protein [Candidatus Tokpelaia sp.]|uniref:hypothetical protein n=1 Tax=Candidatus Tokpelaia sp. TaxID=2233777 RepID=UPI00123887B0|nr:hypothetical protein [Candidatus Tokpelaia sp.]